MVDDQLDDELTGEDEADEEPELAENALDEGTGLGGDDVADEKGGDDEEDQDEGDDEEDTGRTLTSSSSESDEDDEEPDPDDVEEDLDTILRDRIAANEDEDEDEDEEPAAPVEAPAETGNRVSPKRPGEFVCQSCFLVKPPSQLADDQAMFCNDCV